MHAHLLAKMDSSAEAFGKVDTTYYGVAPPPFLAPKEPFCTCIVGKFSLTSRMRNMWSLYFFSGQDAAPLYPYHYLYIGASVHRGQTSAAQPGESPPLLRSSHPQPLLSLFSTSLPTLVISCLFDPRLSNRCEVIARCGFDLHFPGD